ncbi:hypothetical protein CSA56_00615 [candidate division KSB3 bacterium]|uniref:DUF4342 domain-containing protein n=1 Tax=candidate division KSB3 bacterium TaxID=2044937 RepID=A0A2G6KKX7_9BACT|nr:MAG: hypothetical protein CSA56_00615 [candidate division KSB3 bacterium]
MGDEHKNNKRTWTEEFEIAGNELVDKVKEWIEDGSATRLIIRKPNGDVLMEVPVVAGAAVGGVVTVFAPVIAAVGAMAALLAQVKVEIVREQDDDDQDEEIRHGDV